MDSVKIDLHCHTNYSFDSDAVPEDVCRSAIQKGIKHLAITDHCAFARHSHLLLRAGTLAAHRENRLMLLGSPSDMVRGHRLRKTHSSTQKKTRRTALPQSSKKGSTPAYSGFQVQGPATPPAGMALFYGLLYYYTKRCADLQ